MVGCSENRLERSLYDFRTIIHSPTLVIIPLRDQFRLRGIMRKRSLLLHVMLRQETSWYALDSKEYLLSPLCLNNSEN